MKQHTIQSLKQFTLRIKTLWEEGKIKVPVHLCDGNEAQLIEIFKEVNHDDYVFSSHRNHYHALLHGIQDDKITSELLGREEGLAGGHCGSMGTVSVQHRFFSSGIVAGMCAIAVGVAWAIKQDKENRRKVWVFVGDGATDEGHFWEALRYAIGHDLPIVFVIEDNNRATCTSDATRWKDATCMSVFKGFNHKVRYYRYTPRYPHVGSGKYVQF